MQQNLWLCYEKHRHTRIGQLRIYLCMKYKTSRKGMNATLNSSEGTLDKTQGHLRYRSATVFAHEFIKTLRHTQKQ